MVERLRALLGGDVCYRDPGVGRFGLHNALFAIGDTFLEVVSPQKEGTTAGRLLARRGGDGGYMVLLQTDTLADDRARFEALGVREVWDCALEDIAAVHLHPKDIGAAIVSFDQPLPPDSWRWGGPTWTEQRCRYARAIVAAELQSGDPAGLCARWSEVLDRPGRKSADGTHAIDLDEGQLLFLPDTDGRGEGLAGLVLQRTPGSPAQDTILCGTRFRFTD